MKTAELTMAEAYDMGEEAVSRGTPFLADLAHGSLRVGGTKIADSWRFLGKGSAMGSKDPLGTVERLYSRYKRSIPGEKERRRDRRGSWFQALPLERLSDDDMLYGERRDEARFRLEAYVLLTICSGELKWDPEWGSWFWKSPADRDLVLLKDWFPVTGKTHGQQ